MSLALVPATGLPSQRAALIALSRRINDAEAQLDRAFMALADPIRRAIVARPSRGPGGP